MERLIKFLGAAVADRQQRIVKADPLKKWKPTSLQH